MTTQIDNDRDSPTGRPDPPGYGEVTRRGLLQVSMAGAVALAVGAPLLAANPARAQAGVGSYRAGVLYAEVQGDGSLVHRPSVDVANGLQAAGPGEGQVVNFVPPIDETAEPTLDADGNAIYPLQQVVFEPGAAVTAIGAFDGERFIAETLSIDGPESP